MHLVGVYLIGVYSWAYISLSVYLTGCISHGRSRFFQFRTFGKKFLHPIYNVIAELCSPPIDLPIVLPKPFPYLGMET
jgi:hypothetical protein